MMVIEAAVSASESPDASPHRAPTSSSVAVSYSLLSNNPDDFMACDVREGLAMRLRRPNA
jgi:hypothetical protein